jgi:tetratricopeptide (TPR) repeat protein
MTHLAATAVVTAATQLMRAGQWAAATELLRATQAENPAEHEAIALARAEVAVDQDFAQQTDHAPAALAAITPALEQLPDATTGWDVEMLRLRKDYGTELLREGEPTAAGESDDAAAADPDVRDQAAAAGSDGRDQAVAAGSDSRDRAAAAALAERAERLREQAPDDGRRGMASFYAGVIADNLRGRGDEAFAHFTTALQLGEKSGDELLASLALRHLGDHAHTAGDLVLAREQWERSTELRQRVGHLLGALAQQALLAVLLRDEGDLAGSRVLATEVNRWARQVELPFLVSQTDALLK